MSERKQVDAYFKLLKKQASKHPKQVTISLRQKKKKKKKRLAVRYLELRWGMAYVDNDSDQTEEMREYYDNQIKQVRGYSGRIH